MKTFQFIQQKTNSVIFLIRKIRLYPLLKLDLLRFIYCKIRKYYFVKLKKNLKVWSGSEENMIRCSENGDTTIEHNLKGLHDVSGARAFRIIKPLSVIELYRPLSEMPLKGGELNDLNYQCDAKVLTIGPRTEGEIFCLVAYGFKLKNIRGLDLITYSPYIDLGDMHDMPYSDNTFDIVISSCVLVYSKTPAKACQEILRVCKKDGIVCIAQDTVPNAGDDHKLSTGKQTIFCEDYLTFFKPYVKRIFFQHELPERLRPVVESKGSNYTMSLIFQIEKNSQQQNTSFEAA